MVRIHAPRVLNFIFSHSIGQKPGQKGGVNENAVFSLLADGGKANFRKIGFLETANLNWFFSFFSSTFFLSFSPPFFPKNLEHTLEAVDLGSGTLFSLVNVHGFCHKLWPV